MQLELNPIGSNQNEVIIGSKTILFSYKTPVAYYDAETGSFYKTSKKWSSTTSKHVNKWLGGARAEEVSQDLLDALL